MRSALHHQWIGSILLLAVVLVTLLAGCGRRSNVITIYADGMSFVRDEVRVPAGQPVTLRLVNRDAYAHAFDLDEFDIHFVLPARATHEITFHADLPGTYKFYCGAPGHTAAGMAGTLVVEP